MGQLKALFAGNATNLLFGFSVFLIVYLIARLLKVSPVLALSFAALPFVIAYFVQNPAAPAQLFALLG